MSNLPARTLEARRLHRQLRTALDRIQRATADSADRMAALAASNEGVRRSPVSHRRKVRRAAQPPLTPL